MAPKELHIYLKIKIIIYKQNSKLSLALSLCISWPTCQIIYFGVTNHSIIATHTQKR